MTEICKLNEIPDGGMRPVIVEKHYLVLVRRGDDVYALLDKCPHQGAPLSCGVVTCRRRIDTAGDYHAESVTTRFTCANLLSALIGADAPHRDRSRRTLSVRQSSRSA